MSSGTFMIRVEPIDKKRDVSNAARMCPKCGGASSVYKTRELKNGDILRKKQCEKCGTRFKTVESFKDIVK